MSLRVNVRVQAKSDPPDFAHRLGHGRDRIEFRFALDVEFEDVALQRESDFLVGLSDSGEDNSSRIRTSLLNSKQLSA